MTTNQAINIKPLRLPDWRDARLYPANLSDEQWRWQFLRRHPEYQHMYNLPWGDTYLTDVVANDAVSIHAQLSPERVAELTRGRVESVHYARVIDSTVSERFGVNFLLDPALPTIDPRVARMFWRAHVQYSLVALPTAANWERDYAVGMRAIVFDLRLPLPEQIEKAQRRLEREQRQSGLARLDEEGRNVDWALFLRLLDARTAGATFDEIASSLMLTANETEEETPAELAEMQWQRAQNHLEKFFR